ncbi:hypothetical protein EJ04DRAFT_571383 [Polyplosphaeria fusca]|uniref:Uncharacterized protein n=1 Tax=Polyplosphaeria fusca TaxID=682080 RepID=A0A9P4R8P0_9PLEO|nr:hypothetical protein EJ04DRAFT_571383 [Polyplosphaeria fusca]
MQSWSLTSRLQPLKELGPNDVLFSEFLVSMPPSTRIPPLLQPYVHLTDHDSVILVTSILGASANWLLVRFLCEALSSSPPHQDNGVEEDEDTAVVLVSWLRDWEFWKSEARKGGGLDLERLKREKRFAFVDGLTGLYLPPEEQMSGEQPAAKAEPAGLTGVAVRTPQTILPARNPPRDPTTPSSPNLSTKPPTRTDSSTDSIPYPSTLRTPSLQTLTSTLQTTISNLSPNKTLLILDSPDLLLATQPSLTPSHLTSTFLTLHTHTTHLLLHLSADDALLASSVPAAQPLETNARNLLVKAAYMSSRVLSCRALDTGVARDVSGVVRVTAGGGRGVGAWLGRERLEGGEEEGEMGGEFLYKVGGDGGVRVFERGAGEG